MLTWAFPDNYFISTKFQKMIQKSKKRKIRLVSLARISENTPDPDFLGIWPEVRKIPEYRKDSMT